MLASILLSPWRVAAAGLALAVIVWVAVRALLAST